MSGRRGGYLPAGWRTGEVWLEPDDVSWFGELRRSAQAAAAPLEPLLAGGSLAPSFSAVDAPLPLYRPRRARPRPQVSRGRRLVTRFAPLVASVTAAGIGVPVLVASRSATDSAPLPPLSPTTADAVSERAGLLELQEAAAVPTTTAGTQPAAAEPAREQEKAAKRFPVIRWHHSQAVGLPWDGRLADGVRLPREGPGWVTWDPVLDRSPDRANRRYGTSVLVRTLLHVIAAYGKAHPHAPPVVVGDLSLNGGGEIDEHASHENGLDADIYYPRRDGRPRPPATPGQVDFRLAQDLVDRFVAAGAQMVFVGYALPFEGPAGVVIPYANHEEHLHVRIPPPA